VDLRVEDIRLAGSLELLAKQLVEGFITGLHKSPYHGFSVEFAEHRLYNEGQSTRHIDWKVFARTDRLYTKQYEEETNLRCVLASGLFFQYALSARQAYQTSLSVFMLLRPLAKLLTRQRDAVGLCLFSDKIEEFTPVKSTASHVDKLFTLLEKRVRAPRLLRAREQEWPKYCTR
jgi:uncharacterized protein (DUF58 family)